MWLQAAREAKAAQEGEGGAGQTGGPAAGEVEATHRQGPRTGQGQVCIIPPATSH